MEKLNQWLTLAANLGVLVGIVFLVLEIDQNTRAQNSSTIQEFVAATAENNSILATSEDLMVIASTGDLEGLDALSEVEQRRYTHLATQVFAGWESLYLQRLNGTIDPSYWESKRPGLAETFTKKGVRDFWRANAHLWYDPRFRVEIESLVEDAGIDIEGRTGVDG